MAKKKDETKREINPVLDEAIKKLRKEYGDDVVLQSDNQTKIDAIPTGCFALDRLLGCGGLPKGRIIEIFGQESSGKSTLSLFFASQVQRAGGTCVLIDAENAFDASYAASIGVNVADLLVTQPTSLEEAFATLRAFAETNAIDLIIVDSVAALTPQQELEGEVMFKETMALQARLLGKGIRILTGPVSRSKTVVIFINQIREKVGVVFGNPETTPGGKALKFFSSVRLQVNKGDKILGERGEQIGNTVKIKAVKNKVGFPWRTAEFDLYYGSGVDLVTDTFDTAVELEIIKKTGNTYEYESTKLGVGREQAKTALKADEGLYETIRKSVYAKVATE